MKVLIAIDKWKLETFERLLDEAEYNYTVFPGLTPETLFIRVKTDSAAVLQKIVEAAQLECSKIRSGDK